MHTCSLAAHPGAPARTVAHRDGGLQQDGVGICGGWRRGGGWVRVRLHQGWDPEAQNIKIVRKHALQRLDLLGAALPRLALLLDITFAGQQPRLGVLCSMSAGQVDCADDLSVPEHKRHHCSASMAIRNLEQASSEIRSRSATVAARIALRDTACLPSSFPRAYFPKRASCAKASKPFSSC